MCVSDGEWSEEGQNSLIQFNDSSMWARSKESQTLVDIQERQLKHVVSHRSHVVMDNVNCQHASIKTKFFMNLPVSV